MTGGPGRDIRILPDPAALFRAAADLVLSSVLEKVSSRGRFTLVLSGGSTPRTLYSVLASSPYRDNMPWHQIHVFWADERCVPPDHGDSNYRLAFETLLSGVPIPATNVHRIRGEHGPDRAAAAYEQELRSFFGPQQSVFDLILLGVGADGHTASLFPHSEQLRQQDALVLSVPLEGPLHSRVTLSLSVLNEAARAVFLVAGGAKAAVVRKVLEGQRDALPAAMVRPRNGSVTWLLDSDAARELNARTEGARARSVW